MTSLLIAGLCLALLALLYANCRGQPDALAAEHARVAPLQTQVAVQATQIAGYRATPKR